MSKVLVFGGTVEGRLITEFLYKNKIPARVCVATEYGESLLPAGELLEVSHERLDVEAMISLMNSGESACVVDATHPYAAVVTENIKKACQETGMKYIRLLRESLDYEKDEQMIFVDSVPEAVSALQGTEGNILATTGSKELAAYTKLDDFETRVYARVLSLPNVVQTASELGFTGAHLICMQGPFSKDLNVAMMKQFHVTYMVTKETGKNGGFLEKVEAAKEAGARLVVVGRPTKEEGNSLEEVESMLLNLLDAEELSEKDEEKGITSENTNCQEMNVERKQNLPQNPSQNLAQQVSLVGIGPGNEDGLTIEAKQTICEASLLIGAKRMVSGFAKAGQQSFYAYKPVEIRDYILEHPEYKKVAILLSGDVGFYSGAKRLIETLPMEVTVLPGISSMVSFFAKLKMPWEDVKPLSVHGKQVNLVGLIEKYPKIFAIFGTSDGIANLCKKLVSYDMGEVKIAVGERLSYQDEKITKGKASEFTELVTDPLCVAYIANEMAKDRVITHGLSDESFLRDKVPMTKEEIRTVSISKLQLKENSVVYDVGAGTGSVSMEIARILPNGKVFAIEKKAEAVELLKKNKQLFKADQLEIIEGLAPEALEELPVPTHAFIGGSSGNLKDIVKLLQEKNPKIRIVINAITLETIQEAMDVMKEFAVVNEEVVCMNVSRARRLGKYNLMTAQNPVYIFAFDLTE